MMLEHWIRSNYDDVDDVGILFGFGDTDDDGIAC